MATPCQLAKPKGAYESPAAKRPPNALDRALEAMKMLMRKKSSPFLKKQLRKNAVPGIAPPSKTPRNALATARPSYVWVKDVQRVIRPKQKTRKGRYQRGPTSFRMTLLGISTLFSRVNIVEAEISFVRENIRQVENEEDCEDDVVSEAVEVKVLCHSLDASVANVGSASRG